MHSFALYLSCSPIIEVMEKNPDYKYDTDIMDFHSRVKGCSKEEVYAEWLTYTSQEIAWNSFVEYLEKYHCGNRKKKNLFSAPIAAGYNINRFDMKIINRLSEKYKNIETKEKKSNLFYPRDVLDIMNLVFYWFENISEIKSYSLDNVRDYLGISKDGAHDALKDVKDCAEILIRFIRLHRSLGSKIKFKGSFNEKN